MYASPLGAALCLFIAVVSAVPTLRTPALYLEREITVTVGSTNALQDPLLHDTMVMELEKAGNIGFPVAGVTIHRNLNTQQRRRLEGRRLESLTISVRLLIFVSSS